MDLFSRASTDPVIIEGVEYLILGPLRAVQGGVAHVLGGPRQRMVLAVLLANANQVVPQDALIEAVWSGDPPEVGQGHFAELCVASPEGVGRRDLEGR